MKDYTKEVLRKKRWSVIMPTIVITTLVIFLVVFMIDALIALVTLMLLFAISLFLIVKWYNEGDKAVLINCKSSYSFLDISNADERKKLNDGYVVTYIETTGDNYKRDRIIDIGAVKVKGGKIVDRFASHVYSDLCLPSEVAAATGLSDDILKKAPKAKVALKKLISFIGDLPVVGHDAGFDFDFVIIAMEKEEHKFKLIDTLALSKKAFPDLDDHKLFSLATKLGIDCADFSAMSNALICKELFSKCLEQI